MLRETGVGCYPDQHGLAEGVLRIKAMSDYTFFLFARPSFLEGVSRILDLGATLDEYNRATTGSAADEIALHNDWMALAEDFGQVVERSGEAARGTQATTAE